jgi:Calcineurin-like phosphoesterase
MISEKPAYDDYYAESNGIASDADHPHGRPLVEYYTDEWRTNPRYTSPSRASSPNEELLDRLGEWVDGCLAVIKAPRFRRLILAFIVLITTTIVLWVKVFGPWIMEERAAWASLGDDVAKASGGLFGPNVRPHFPGMIQLADMDPHLLPTSSASSRRLIFVGDIHGCKKELVELMQKVDFNPDTDHLVALGDVVNKGPDSLGVIDYLRAHNASCVRGNHEDTLLLMLNDVKSSSLRSADPDGHVGKPRDHDPLTKLIRGLTSSQISWLRSLPIILRIGNVKGIGDIVAVHGGLVPGIPLQSQDALSVMNMRSIDLRTHIPSKLHEHKGSIPWYRLWNRHQKLLPRHPRWQDLIGKKKPGKDKHTTVVYGHDAKQGLRIEKYTKGLDTNCVKGGQLTALVIDSNGKQHLAQVDCPGYTKPKAKQESLGHILRPAGG